ncbi:MULTISPECIES: type III-A CRISPR-associated protein Csm2 [Tetragenococcus]|uniref:CRISPR system Cms protein Csm2 n=2 Tax=Tetragenococcus muriaticus TaxID=64642 RepID=A0A091C7A1_9ENTE|nr:MULTISPECIES: type III-A CRISPR-associated protein Csm2 [Tetragenococcus]KFN92555.1 CRISPR-associated Csm2 family protein [Tetragenococcus muriaticus 3MR10-3]KFN93308.1 CRISPR-associated Csm2 family protein [Tetragenococcus muriaticus PMC-11-5]MCF1613626.1 type III-A CRISPR-associated protein Csm2 [Tetragenococcus koreensis]MCF1623378.1 type III-A CRISPR-associated protein Csm2 [Tetragenococcus koreensis]
MNQYKSRQQKVSWETPKIHFTDRTYVSEAEAVIKELKDKGFKVKRDTLTTSQIRNLLSLTSTVYDEALSSGIENVMDQVAYLRVQFVYQSGRNEAVKKLVELSRILDILKIVQKHQKKQDLVRFCRYMEALVAYFKYHGGRD